MGQTINVKRIGRTPVTAVEVVYSPDDGGYYLSNVDFKASRSRVSKRVYPSDTEAVADWNAGTVVWEPWH